MNPTIAALTSVYKVWRRLILSMLPGSPPGGPSTLVLKPLSAKEARDLFDKH